MKAKKIIKKVFKWIGNIIFAISMFIFLSSVISIFRGKIPTIFNCNFFIVQTNSMEDTINVNDLVISKKVDIKDVEKGDIITFECIDPSLPIVGQFVTHRVVEDPIVDENGNISLVTKGDNNVLEDTYKVTKDNFTGKVIFYSSAYGRFFSFWSHNGWILIAVIGSVFIVIFILNLNKYKMEASIEEAGKKKKEEQDKLREELLLEIQEELKQEENKEE